MLKKIRDLRVESHFSQRIIGDILQQIQQVHNRLDEMEHNDAQRHGEIMAGLGDIRQALSGISIQIANARGDLVDSLETLILNDMTTEERLAAHDRLHQEFDERLFDRFKELEKRVALQNGNTQNLAIPLSPHIATILSEE